MHRRNRVLLTVKRFLNTKANLLHFKRKIHLFSIEIVTPGRLNACVTHEDGKQNFVHPCCRHESGASRPENVAVQFLREKDPLTLLFWRDSQSSYAKM